MLDPSTASRSGKALIPVGLTVRRAALDPMRSFPGLGRTLQGFLRGKRWKSLKLNSVSPMNGALATKTGYNTHIIVRFAPTMGP